jgi:hypothetical protein
MILAGLLAVFGAIRPAPAAASCVASPAASPHRFSGTVIRVEDAGRTATVRTDDGHTVTVHGGYASEPGVVTTVDRTYQIGVRYEFHPLNSASPYQDNACTATHPIAALTGGGAPASATDKATPAVQIAHAQGHTWRWWLAGTGAIVAVAGVGGLWWRRRIALQRGVDRVDNPYRIG